MSESLALGRPVLHPDLSKLKRIVFPLLLFCAFSALCIRGVFEVTIGKSLAYLVQLALWTLMLFLGVAAYKFRTTRFLTFGIALSLLFGVIGVISTIWTMDVAGFAGGLLSTLINVYLLCLFVVGYGFRTDAFTARPVIWAMAVAGTLLPIVGALQMFGFAKLPGESLFREPSLTGSYLHFPLLCGVLGISLMQAAKTLRMYWLYPIVLLCFFGVGISGGRSGALVLVGTGCLYVLFELSRKSGTAKIKFVFWILILVAAVGAAAAVAYQYSPSLQRIAQLGSLQEAGNRARITIWGDIYDNWRDTNLWFGEYTGLVGNTTNNLAGGITRVAESGVLQQLINFGVLGFLAFYGVMLLGYFDIDKENTYLRALFASALVQTSFYQSTEVFPYMAMLAFLPIFSRSLLAEARRRHSNQGL